MKKRKIINYFIMGITFFVMLWLVMQEYGDTKQEKNDMEESSQYEAQSLGTNYNLDDEERNIISKIEAKEYPKENIASKYKEYDVLAKLEIPAINLETYILEECTKESLNKSVARFWGVGPNEIGNFCVAGHNAPRNNNMFYNLKKLEIGNKFTISDNTIGKVEYEIYDIYNVLPEDVSCLSQETNGEREVTLITCTNDSKKRTIVKAKEVK